MVYSTGKGSLYVSMSALSTWSFCQKLIWQKKMPVAVISRNRHNNRQQSIPSYCNFKHFRENLIFANNAIGHVCEVKISGQEHDLPKSVNDIVISPFREGFIFTKLCIEDSRKWTPRNNFWIYCIQRKKGQFCKVANFREVLFLRNFEVSWNKILAKWRNHSVVYWYRKTIPLSFIFSVANMSFNAIH